METSETLLPEFIAAQQSKKETFESTAEWFQANNKRSERLNSDNLRRARNGGRAIGDDSVGVCRRDYDENFAPVGPSWAVVQDVCRAEHWELKRSSETSSWQAQTPVPRQPGIWYMQLACHRFVSCLHGLRLDEVRDSSSMRHERQNQEGKHVRGSMLLCACAGLGTIGG